MENPTMPNPAHRNTVFSPTRFDKSDMGDLKSPPISSREPPACVQNAMMNKDKKPFTYTPGGLDLSQIRSEKMARRLMINAMSPGVQEKPAQPPFTPNCETPPIKTPMNYYNLPVPVFPSIQIPANPKALLRRTSGPYNRSESVDRALETSAKDNDDEKTPTAESINKLDSIKQEAAEPKKEDKDKPCSESEPEIAKQDVKKPETPKKSKVPDVPRIQDVPETKGIIEPIDKAGQCLLSCLNMNRERSPSPFKLETTSDRKEPSFLLCQNNKTRDRSPSPFRLETHSDIKENGFPPSQSSDRPRSPFKPETPLINSEKNEDKKTEIDSLNTESPKTKENVVKALVKETEIVILDKIDEDGDVTPKIDVDTKLFESVISEIKNKENHLPVEEEEKESVGDIISRFNKSVSPIPIKEKVEKKENKKMEKKENDKEVKKEDIKEERKEDSFLRENRESISSRRNTENIKSLNNDLDSLPSLSLCSKRFSFLGDNSITKENENDAFSVLTGTPAKISLIDRKDNKTSTVNQMSCLDRIENKEPQSQPPTIEILPPWKLIENDIPINSTETRKSFDSKVIQDGTWKPTKSFSVKNIDSLLQPIPQSDEFSQLCKNNSWNKPKPDENLVPVNANCKDDTEPAWKRELREIASQKRESKEDSDFYREEVEPPWRRELRELSESKLSRDMSQSRLSRDISQSRLSTDMSQSTSRDVSQSRLSRDVSESGLSRETSEARLSQPRERSQSRLSRGSSQLESSFEIEPPWKPSCKLNYSKSDADDKTESVINPLWSQTIRPKTWRERKADLSRDKEVEVPEWKKVGELRRNFVNSFLNKSTSSSSSCSSPAREIRKTPEITVEIAGNPTSTPAAPANNGYTYPWESSSESSAAFSPEPYTFDRTPTPQSRNSPFRQTPQYVYADMHSPSIPREYGTLSYEPNRRQQIRSCPIQSRSFKYLQLLTGTTDTYEDDEPFIPQSPLHSHLRPESYKPNE